MLRRGASWIQGALFLGFAWVRALQHRPGVSCAISEDALGEAVDVNVEEDDDAVLKMHPVVGVVCGSAASREDGALECSELLEHAGLELAESVLAIIAEDLADRFLSNLLDDVIRVKLGVVERVCKLACDGALAAPHHADKEDAGALGHLLHLRGQRLQR